MLSKVDSGSVTLRPSQIIAEILLWFHSAIFAASSVTSRVKSAPLMITVAFANVDQAARVEVHHVNIIHPTNHATLHPSLITVAEISSF
jgi:hypothetical protein